MKRDRLCILVCELFAPEIHGVAASGTLPYVDFATFAGRCGRPPLSLVDLQAALPDFPDYGRVLLFGGCCLSRLESAPELLTICRFSRLDSCFCLVADRSTVHQYQRGGGYLVTPGWLQSWRRHLDTLGFAGDRETAMEFFAESARSIILLETGATPDAAELLASFAGYIGLPAITIPVGLDLLRLRIELATSQWQADSCRNSHELLQRICADYIMALDLLDLIAQSNEESEIVGKVLTLFQTLFAATGVAFVSFNDGLPDKVILQGYFEEGVQAELLSEAAALRSESALPDDDGGRFLLQVNNRGQTLGVIVVDGLALPRYREQYLSLALTTAELSGIILKNARVFNELNAVTRELAGQRDELHKAYADLRDAKAVAFQQEKLAAIGQLAAGVAHEINNPLGFIVSNLGTLGKYLNRIIEFIEVQADCLAESGLPSLRKRAGESATRLKIEFILRDSLQLVSESATGAGRVQKIIRNLKIFSRVDDSAFASVDLNDCLESAISIAQSELAPVAQIRRRYGIIPRLRCYPQQLSLLFMNLLFNAAHALTGRGSITVTTWLEGETICAAISDTGCGIPEAHLSRIFEPFFTTREVGMGTGLGLSLSYDIVKRHSGELTVESRVGEGSTFTVRLPIVGLP